MQVRVVLPGDEDTARGGERGHTRNTSGSHGPATQEERLWASLAHASTILTLIVGMLTGNLSGLVLVFVPLAIYFAYRERSPFVTFHALQAFALQVLATIGWLLLLVGGGLALAIGWVVSALLVLVLVGLLLLPVMLVVTLAFALLMVVAPIALGLLALVAAIEVYSGEDYRYPYLGEWLNEQLSDGVLGIL